MIVPPISSRRPGTRNYVKPDAHMRKGAMYVGTSYPGDVLHLVQIGSRTVVFILNPDHPVRVMRPGRKPGVYVIEVFDGCYA
jgi:hypothetical protein